MALVFARAVFQLRHIPSTPRLLRHVASVVHPAVPLSFSASIRSQSLTQPRQIGYAVYAGQTTPRCSKSAEKRHRQSEKRRVLNRARKNEVKTRMKNVLKTLDKYRKKSPAAFEDLDPVNPLMSAAFKAIDKAVKNGTLHRNTGARRKSKLNRAKQRILIQSKLIKPPKAPEPPSLVEAYEARKKAKREAIAKFIKEKMRQKETEEENLAEAS